MLTNYRIVPGESWQPREKVLMKKFLLEHAIECLSTMDSNFMSLMLFYVWYNDHKFDPISQDEFLAWCLFSPTDLKEVNNNKMKTEPMLLLPILKIYVRK